MKKAQLFWIVVATLLFIGFGIYLWQSTDNEDNESTTLEQQQNTGITVTPLVENLDKPWDVKVSNDGTIYFTQRQSGLYKYNERVEEIYLPEDLFNIGEGGMLGFDLSPNFDEDREIYVCFNSKSSILDPNIVVARLILTEDLNSVEEREDIIMDIPSALSGRHSGCRVQFDRNREDVLWITTGDAANASNPQDPKNLGGKVLRVNTQGEGVEGNMEEPFDSRIFSYGHRNIQGITLFEEYHSEYGYGFTAEHGPNVDDEINPLIKGNFGWDPKPPYIESVPMTDLEKYPDAIEALWSSGDRTIAMCGIQYIEQGQWQGDILLAALKDSYILRFRITEEGDLERVEEVINDYGRIRQVYQTPNGRILFTTDNGNDDVIGEIIL